MNTSQAQSWLTWQKALILASALLVCAYVVGVLWQVQAVPEIGLHCSFRPVISTYDTGYLRAADGQPIPELTGATIEQVGDRMIGTWPQLLRSLEALERVSFPEHEGLPAAGGGNYARYDKEEWVRVRLRTAAGAPAVVWCLVGQAPPSVLLPSLLWMGLELGVFAIAALIFWMRT